MAGCVLLLRDGDVQNMGDGERSPASLRPCVERARPLPWPRAQAKRSEFFLRFPWAVGAITIDLMLLYERKKLLQQADGQDAWLDSCFLR